jgi:hypothetical protein
LLVILANSLSADRRQQVLFQVSHEAVHAACSVDAISRPVDEMFAVLFSLRVMDTLAPDYAAAMRNSFTQAASTTSASDLLAFASIVPGRFRDDGRYGRAMLLGDALEGELGWETFRGLVRPGEPACAPDFAAWLSGLPDDARAKVEAVVREQDSAAAGDAASG